MNTGKIVQVVGPVVDVEFTQQLPAIYNALTVDFGVEDKKFKLTLEVQQHLGDNWVRAVAYSPDGSRVVSGSLDSTLKVWDAEARLLAEGDERLDLGCRPRHALLAEAIDADLLADERRQLHAGVAQALESLADPALSVSSLAAQLGLSASQIHRVFASEPLTPAQYIWERRLEACSRDLREPRLAGRTVSEIAFGRGFNDAAHFSRVFRERFGCSPREWRLRH